MRAYRTLPLLLILVVVGGVLGGCSRGPSEEELKLAELQEQFATIQQLNGALQQARADLAAAEASVRRTKGTAGRAEGTDRRTHTDPGLLLRGTLGKSGRVPERGTQRFS